MAIAAVSQQTRVAFSSDRSAGTPLHTDKEIAEAASSEVATFLLENDLELDYSRSKLNNLRVTPLTRDEVSFAIRLIGAEGHPLVVVVPRAGNRNESGRYSITMERELSISELSHIGIKLDDGAALGIMESEVNLKLITVSDSSFAAMKRHRDYLARNPPILTNYHLRSLERQYLIPQKKGCCDKISDCASSALDACCKFIPKCCEFMCCITCLAIVGGSIYGGIKLGSD